MRLDTPFIRLPYRFDAVRLKQEADALPEAAWQPHPRELPGVSIAPLIAVEGAGDEQTLLGPMAATPHLEQLPYLQQALTTFNAVLGRTQLVRIESVRSTGKMVDDHYYFQDRVLIYLPITEHKAFKLRSGEDEIKPKPGEVWLLDTWRGYELDNQDKAAHTGLALYSVGSMALWAVVDRGEMPFADGKHEALSPRRIGYRESFQPELELEDASLPPVLAPGELSSLIEPLARELTGQTESDEQRELMRKMDSLLQRFQRQWRGLWAHYGASEAGLKAYRQAVEQLRTGLLPMHNQLRFANGMEAAETLFQIVGLHAVQADPVWLEHAKKAQADAANQRRAEAQAAAGSNPPADASQQTIPHEQEPDASVEIEAEDTDSKSALNYANRPLPKVGQAQAKTPEEQREEAQKNAQKALRSVFTQGLPKLLTQIQSSLVVSTYQAGKLILVRADGDKINTHFRMFAKPMGVAANTQRLALGTAQAVEIFANVPGVGHKLEPQGKHDACYIPRMAHVTGNIDIHEMAWADDGLWVVNTRFSCLCTLDKDHSFTPRWRPPFITAYQASDRCHLNGLEVVDGKPKYVTALGETDTPGGWRENKGSGGVLMDVDSGEVITRGLSMPHSPRWYQGKLWVLESGNGSLATVDPKTGQVETVAQLPGFTRGLDFIGPLAFVGLSQVRESAVFSGIAITERVTERNCGVWVVNIETGQTVGFIRFEEAVREIFAVQILNGIRFPELLQAGHKPVNISWVLPDDALKEVAPLPASATP